MQSTFTFTFTVMMLFILTVQAHPLEIKFTNNSKRNPNPKPTLMTKKLIGEQPAVKMGVIGRTAQTMASTAIANTLIVPSLVHLNDLDAVKDGSMTRTQASLAYGAFTSILSGVTNAFGEVIYRAGRKARDNTPMVAKRESVTPMEAAALNAIPLTILSKSNSLKNPKEYMKTMGTTAALTSLVSVPVKYVTEGIAKFVQK